MNEQKYDMVVIGTGPGGEGAAMQACKQGKDVAVIEKAVKIGGNCTHKGTIPSKALRFAIYRMTETNQNALFREAGITASFSFAQLRRSAAAVISKQVDMRQTFYERNRVPVLQGTAKFIERTLGDNVDDAARPSSAVDQPGGTFEYLETFDSADR